MDPVTIVSGVASFVAGLVGQNKTDGWQADASEKLNQILTGLHNILNAIAELRVEIRRDFIQNELDRLVRQISAKQQMIDVCMGSARTFHSIPKIQKDKIRHIAYDVEDEAFQLMEIGFGGYLAVGAGFSILATTYKILGYQKTSFDVLCDKYLKYFGDAINPNNKKGFQYWLIHAEQVIPPLTAFLNAFDQRAAQHGCKLGEETFEVPPKRDGSGGGTRTIDWVGWLNGSRNSGYTVRAIDMEGGQHEPFYGFGATAHNSTEAHNLADIIVGEVNTKAADWKWSTDSIDDLKRYVPNIEELIKTVELAKRNYRV
ncbi:MAG: hypothetical protein JSR61_15130 [Proteobacteria bacterium]|nr:hypothetical protein [Pseudomonadota bacterium]